MSLEITPFSVTALKKSEYGPRMLPKKPWRHLCLSVILYVWLYWHCLWTVVFRRETV